MASRLAPPLCSIARRVAGALASNAANGTSGNTVIVEAPGVMKFGIQR